MLYFYMFLINNFRFLINFKAQSLIFKFIEPKQYKEKKIKSASDFFKSKALMTIIIVGVCVLLIFKNLKEN